MVQILTQMRVTDNSGAKLVRVIGIPGFSKRKWALIGDIITVSIRDALPMSTIKTHSVVRAVVVRSTKETRRKDGSYVRFDDNAVVILDGKTKNPKGTRMFGPIARELKEKGFDKIISLAPEVL